MTDIEKRAEILYPHPDNWEQIKDNKWACDLYGAQREAYIKGASEREELVIDKACEIIESMGILENYTSSITFGPGTISLDLDKLLEDFKKKLKE